MKIKKAIITAAGFGTRFLPITKTVQKEMLPILNRPIVDYIVEDCIKAGIEEIIFVISEHNMQLIHFYRENERLRQYLKRMKKGELYEKIRHLHSQALFTFIRQPDNAEYGTAVPVKIAKQHLKDEDGFLVFMGDDFIYNDDGKSEAKRMINLFKKTRSSGLATCIEKPEDELFRYGVADTNRMGDHLFLNHLVEKPNPGTAPSNLVNISKYIFSAEIFDIIAEQKVDPKSGELYITDSISLLAQKQPVVIHQPVGEYMDGGNLSGWLRANLSLASRDPKLRKVIEDFTSQLQTS